MKKPASMKMTLRKIAQMSLALTLSLLLSACLKSVPENDNETATRYGTFTTGAQADKEINQILRELINFNGSQAGYEDGYYILNRNNNYKLYLGIYSLNTSLVPNEWIKGLLDGIAERNNWTETNRLIELGTAEFNTKNNFQGNAGNDFTVSVRIMYNQKESNYWVYFAIPSSMLSAADFNDNEISSLFYQYRFEKK